MEIPSTSSTSTTPASPLVPSSDAAATAAASVLMRLRYDALARQLESARARQDIYTARFFSCITLSTGTLLSIYLIASSGLFPFLFALLPFLVVSAGVQAAFFLHGADFARLCAAALESRLNQLLESDLLVLARMEDAWLFPLGESRFSAVMGKPERMICICALHWGCVLLFFYLAGALEGWRVLAEHQRFFAMMLASWTGLNGIYLLWHYSGRQELAAAEQMLADSGFRRSADTSK